MEGVNPADTAWMLAATALVILMTPALGLFYAGLVRITGILFVGLFAQLAWNDVANGLIYGDASQLASQALAVLVAPAYAFAATFLILRGLGALTRLRASEREEALGMDIVQHGEEAYLTGGGAILIGVGSEHEQATATRSG